MTPTQCSEQANFLQRVKMLISSSDQSILLRMVLYTKASGWEIFGTATAYRSGLMVQSTKVDGFTIKLRAVEFSGTRTVMSSMVSGRRTRHMASEFTPTPTERSMKENGKVIFKTD